MRSDFRSAIRVLTGMTLTAAFGVSSAQTPAQLEYERQQREYWRQQEQQRQEQQRQQQIMQENARRQQEESRRINAPSGQSSGSFAPGATQGSSSATQAARGRPIRRPGGVGCPRNVGEAACAAARPQPAPW
jgi:hypothetical protein